MLDLKGGGPDEGRRKSGSTRHRIEFDDERTASFHTANDDPQKAF
jgi:hypothetical protein